jgi:cytochrome oxidase Cu insertion factor (SCO1/SenC/PrrC family)
MFAMKKLIFSAALILTVSGFTAAQSSAKPAAKKEAKVSTHKVFSVKNNSNKKTVLKQETSANAKNDSGRLILVVPRFPLDTAAVPMVKNDENL